MTVSWFSAICPLFLFSDAKLIVARFHIAIRAGADTDAEVQVITILVIARGTFLLLAIRLDNHIPTGSIIHFPLDPTLDINALGARPIQQSFSLPLDIFVDIERTYRLRQHDDARGIHNSD